MQHAVHDDDLGVGYDAILLVRFSLIPMASVWPMRRQQTADGCVINGKSGRNSTESPINTLSFYPNDCRAMYGAIRMASN